MVRPTPVDQKHWQDVDSYRGQEEYCGDEENSKCASPERGAANVRSMSSRRRSSGKYWVWSTYLEEGRRFVMCANDGEMDAPILLVSLQDAFVPHHRISNFLKGVLVAAYEGCKVLDYGTKLSS